jgi:hypothetical protein
MLAAVLLTVKPAGQVRLVLFPNGLPHVPRTVTVKFALLLVLLVSARVSATWLVLLPATTPRTGYV